MKNQLLSAWKSATSGTSSNVSIAIHSRKTGQTYTYTNNSSHRFKTASTIKVSVLTELLLKNNGKLDSTEKSLATKMIENSDNDSTSTLVDDYLGGVSALDSLFEKMGMTNTNTTSDGWGTTRTTAPEMIKLLDNIFFSSNILTTSEQNYIKSLMSNVESDQQWGISAGSSKFYIKNGWLTDDDNNDLWVINSIGYIDGKGDNDYTIAVYTDGNATMSDGEQLIESIAKKTRSVMDSELNN